MIREATSWDALVALSMAEAYVAEAGSYADTPYDAETAVSNMITALDDPRQLFIMAINSKGEAVGMLWAVCASLQPWTSELTAVDKIVYVRPEYRGTKHGLALLKTYEEWAINKGAFEIYLSVGSGIHEEKTGCLYNKLGYATFATQYRRKTNVGNHT